MNLFQEALEQWLSDGGPMDAYAPPTFERNPAKVWPSCFYKCPKAHALERLGAPPTVQLPDRELAMRHKMQLGHLTAWKWYNILQHADLNVQHEQVFETADISGHIDILLDGQYPIEIKLTNLRFAERHFLQAACYAHAYGSCYLILDHGDGNFDPLWIVRMQGYWTAIDMRTSEPFTHRNRTRELSDYEFTDRMAVHQGAFLFGGSDAHRLAGITEYQCYQRGSYGIAQVMCPHWCWGGDGRAFFPFMNDKIAIEGEPFHVMKGEW